MDPGDIALIIAGILIFLWLLAGVFVTMANVKLGKYKNTDDKLHDAYWNTFWAAFTTWLTLGICIVLVIVILVLTFGSGAGEVGLAGEAGVVGVEGAETAEAATSFEKLAMKEGKERAKSKSKSKLRKFFDDIEIAFLVFSLFLVSLTGVFSAIAANDIKSSPNYDPSNRTLVNAYKECIYAAVMCLVAAGSLFIGLIIYFIYRLHVTKQQKALNAKIQKENAEKQTALLQRRKLELEHLKAAKEKSIHQKAAKYAAYKEQLEEAQQEVRIEKILSTAPPTSPQIVP